MISSLCSYSAFKILSSFFKKFYSLWFCSLPLGAEVAGGRGCRSWLAAQGLCLSKVTVSNWALPEFHSFPSPKHTGPCPAFLKHPVLCFLGQGIFIHFGINVLSLKEYFIQNNLFQTEQARRMLCVNAGSENVLQTSLSLDFGFQCSLVLFPQAPCQKGTALGSLCMENLPWSIDFSQDLDRLVW